MASDKISQKISDLYEHIEGLKMKGMTDPETASEVLSDALEELQASLEELSAADEELCQQNEELILTQSKLQESEEKYRELVENANSIIIKMDSTGKISFFNEYAQKFFGYSSEEILGQDVKVLVPPIESGSGRSLEEMADDIIRSPDDFI
ncbi:MAG TPA: PAS domain S-box protein, partial [Methanotrichaceae archaeon]|nr:PAS domain S-box protein [Methanotrichaceae archaeon]